MKYERIISLTPSITETLFALGVEDRVVGVTDACDYPPEANSKYHVCSWFDPDVDRITSLKPDLVLGLATAHQRLASLFEASDTKFTLLNPVTLDDALTDMLFLGTLLGMEEIADLMVTDLKRRVAELAAKVRQIRPEEKITVSRVLDIEGENLIVAGPKSFQYDVIKQAGGKNITTTINEAYPRVPFQTFKAWDAGMIFFCGTDQSYLSRLQEDPLWQSLSAVRYGRINQFDCGLTCRTGPRIVDMAEILFQTLYA